MRAELQALPPGYLHHGEKILELVEFHQPQVVVELGTFKGASAVAIARLLKTWGGHLFCVDSWTPATTGEAGVLSMCAAHLAAAGVAPWVRLIAAPSGATAAAWNGLPIDALYVDADHTRDGVTADLEGWWPHLRVGGLILGDDYGHPDFPGVADGWDAFERAHRQVFTRHATAGATPPEMRLIYGTKAR